MAKDDIVVRIGAAVSTSFDKSLNAAGSSIKKFGKRMNNQFTKLDRDTKLLKNVEARIASTDRTLRAAKARLDNKNKNSTFMYYTEQVRKYNNAIEDSKKRINELTQEQNKLSNVSFKGITEAKANLEKIKNTKVLPEDISTDSLKKTRADIKKVQKELQDLGNKRKAVSAGKRSKYPETSNAVSISANKLGMYDAQIEKAKAMVAKREAEQLALKGKVPSGNTSSAMIKAQQSAAASNTEVAKANLAKAEAERAQYIEKAYKNAYKKIDDERSRLGKKLEALNAKEKAQAKDVADKKAEAERIAQDKKNSLIAEAEANVQKEIDAYEKARNAAVEKSKTIDSSIENENRKIEDNTSSIKINERKIEEWTTKAKDDIYQAEQAYAKLQQRQQDLQAETEILTQNMQQTIGSFLRGTLAKTLNGISNSIIRLGKVAVKTLGKMSGLFSSTTSKALSLSKVIRLIVQYGFGFRSLFYLIRRLRSGIVEGFEYLGGAMKKSKTQTKTWANNTKTSVTTTTKSITGAAEEVGELISTIKKLGYYLKSAAAAMLQPFTPLINTIIPKLVDWFNRLSITIGKFIATLTNQKYIYVASTNLDDYANALDEVSSSAVDAKKNLAAFDDINVLEKNDSSTTNSTTTDTSGWFTQMEVGTSSIAKLMKDAWEKDADFTEVGKVLGDKISKALDISWETVKEKVGKAGKALATLFNGLAEAPELAKSIGEFAAGIVNSIGEFIYNYVTNTNWTQIGSAIGESISTFIQKVDMSQYGTSLHDFIVGIMDAIGAAILKLGDDEVSVGEKIGEFFGGLDIPDIASKLTDLAKLIAEGISDALADWADKDPESFGIARALAIAAVGTKITATIFSWLAGPIALALSQVIVKAMTAKKVTEGIAEGISTAIYKASQDMPKLLTTTALVPSDGVIDADFKVKATKTAGIFTKLVQGLKTSFSSLLTTFSNMSVKAKIIIAIVTALITAFVALYTTNEEFRKSVNDLVTNIFATLGSLYNNVIKPLFDLLLAVAKPVFDSIVAVLLDLAVVIFPPLVAFIDMILNVLKESIFPLLGALIPIFTDIFSIILAWLPTIVDILGKVLTVIIGIVTFILNILTPIIETFITAICTLIQWLFDWIRVRLDAAVVICQTFWESVKETAKGYINTLIGFVNGLVSAIVGGINTVIRALNALKFDVPSWVTKLTGVTSFGFNLHEIKAPQIPYLAQGAVIPPNKQFLAMLGDQKSGTNIEAPLDTIVQAMQMALGNNNQTIVMNIDGKTFARLTVPRTLDELKRSGYNVKVLEG